MQAVQQADDGPLAPRALRPLQGSLRLARLARRPEEYVLLLPLDRIRDLLRLQGVLLAMLYLVTQVQRVAGLLGPIDAGQSYHKAT